MLSLANLQVCSRVFATLCYNVVADFLAVVEAIETCFFNSANVDKNIAAACIWLDEAKTFCSVKPFYCAGRHSGTLSQFKPAQRAVSHASRAKAVRSIRSLRSMVAIQRIGGTASFIKQPKDNTNADRNKAQTRAGRLN